MNKEKILEFSPSKKEIIKSGLIIGFVGTTVFLALIKYEGFGFILIIPGLFIFAAIFFTLINLTTKIRLFNTHLQIKHIMKTKTIPYNAIIEVGKESRKGKTKVSSWIKITDNNNKQYTINNALKSIQEQHIFLTALKDKNSNILFDVECAYIMKDTERLNEIQDTINHMYQEVESRLRNHFMRK